MTPARTAAWSSRDGRALRASLGSPLRWHLVGVPRSLVTSHEIMAGLAVLAERTAGLRVAPAVVVPSVAGRAIEWIGTIGRGGARRRFAFIELWTSLPERCKWHVLFDTSDL